MGLVFGKASMNKFKHIIIDVICIINLDKLSSGEWITVPPHDDAIGRFRVVVGAI